MKSKVKFLTAYGFVLLVGVLLTGCAQKPASQPENASGQAVEQNQSSGEQQEPASDQNSSRQITDSTQNNEAKPTEGQNETAQPDASYDQESETPADSGLEQAKTAALANAELEASQVTFTKAEPDYDDGIKVYEIEFVTSLMKYEYEIKADDFSVLEMSKETIEQVNENGQRADLITLEEAKAIALSYAEISEEEISYTKLELDYDDGIAEYEVEFYTGGKEYSLTIDAISGTVTEMEME